MNISKIQTLVDSLLKSNGTNLVYKMSNNFSSTVFKITGNKVYYLKVASEKTENFLPEFNINKILIKNKIKVPKIIEHKNFPKDTGGLSYILMSEIKGLSTTQAECNNVLLREVGRSLAKINSIRIDGFGMIDRFKRKIRGLNGTKNTHLDFILNSYVDKLNLIYHSKIITKNQIKIIIQFIEDNKHALDIKVGNLVHGDFCGNHIIHNDGKLTGIIDFGDSKVSNQFYDLAYLKICNRNLFESIFRGYRSEILLPKNWKLILKLTIIIVGIRIISSEINDIEFIDMDIFRDKVTSFKTEIDTL